MLLALQLGGCAEPGLLPKPLGLLGAAGAGLRDDAATPFPDAQWWRALGAPALDALVEQALAGQPSLDTAAARLTRAAAKSGWMGNSRPPRSTSTASLILAGRP